MTACQKTSDHLSVEAGLDWWGIDEQINSLRSTSKSESGASI